MGSQAMCREVGKEDQGPSSGLMVGRLDTALPTCRYVERRRQNYANWKEKVLKNKVNIVSYETNFWKKQKKTLQGFLTFSEDSWIGISKTKTADLAVSPLQLHRLLSACLPESTSFSFFPNGFLFYVETGTCHERETMG